MSYVALYRKFRPQNFEEVKGQDHVVHTLKNQLLCKRIGHAYLFTGTRGTGKTSVAKIFAKAVNCLHPVNGEPCNQCENCRAVNAGNFVDVVEVDAASNNGVDDIRRIIEEVRYTPVSGAYKVFIIDEAHMITGAAFNAFLKTLEEPPAYVIFILATTEPHKLPITILSRCQRYDFRRISSRDIAGNLNEIVKREGVEADDKALEYIAHAGDGSMRDAVSLLDKCIAFNLGEKLTYDNVLDTLGTVDTEVFSKLFRSVYAGDAATALSLIDTAVSEGRDLTQFATDLIWYIRSMLLVGSAAIRDPDMLGISVENMELLMQDVRMAEDAVLMRYIRILSEVVNQIRLSAEKQILLEVAVIKLARPQMETDTDSLADRIRHLEAGAGRMGSGQAYPSPETGRQLPPPGQRMQQTAFAQPAMSQEMPVYEQEPFAAADMNMYASVPPEEWEMQMPESIPPEDPVEQIMGQLAGTSGQTAQPGNGPSSGEPVWEQVVRLCENPRIRSVLHKCSADVVEGNNLRIYAPNEFVIRQLKEDDVLSYIRQLASRILNGDVQVQPVLGQNKPDRDPAQSAFPEELLKNINFHIGTEEW